MAAYIYADVQVTDSVLFEKYRGLVPAVIKAYGGRYLVRGGASEVLEGTRPLNRNVVIEFPDMASLEAFYNSPEYKPLIAMRQRAATSSLFAMEGV
jgi:uncharacterized protein (DUF1330 family)